MKPIKPIILILMAVVLLAGCSLEPNHSIRVKNQYAEAINNVMIGSVSYGTVGSGSTTNYKPVDEGTHNISGTTISGNPLTGSLSVSGKGTHKWTMTITSSGVVEIKED